MLIQNSNFLNIVLFISIIFCVSCKDKAATTASATNQKIETTPGIATTYELYAQDNYLSWSMYLEEKMYKFRTPVTLGRISVLDGVITTGDFDIDLKNPVFQQVNAEVQLSLSQKLQDTTYFNTAVTPLSRLVISKIEKNEVKSNYTHKIIFDLTLNNRTRAVIFPVNINNQKDCFELKSASVDIDIADWGIVPNPENSPKTTIAINTLLCHKK